MLFAAGLAAQTTNTNLITTLAGTDGSLAGGVNAAAFPLPPGPWGRPVADAAGNIYFSLTNQNVVVRLTPAGRLERFAGTGFSRYSGDGGPANQAALNSPGDVAVDSRGSVYIVDTGNKRIRRVSPNGVMETFAGGGRVIPSAAGVALTDAALSAPRAITVDATDNVYFSIDEVSVARVDYGATQVRLFAGVPGVASPPQTGPLSGARFRLIASLSADKAGNLYVSDALAVAVIRISPSGRFEVLANRSAGFGVLVDAVADASGAVYFTQLGTPVIWRLQGANNTVDVYAGNIEIPGSSPTGTARDRALFSSELRLGIDSQGRLLVGDRTNGRLRRVSSVVESLAGTDFLYTGEAGPATAANFQTPVYVAQSRAGTYYFSDSAARVVFSIDTKGTLRRFAGSGLLNGGFIDGKPALEGNFGIPYGIAVDAAGVVYVADDDCAIRRIGTDGVMRLHAGLPGLCSGSTRDGTALAAARFGRLRGLTLDSAGNLYATDVMNHKVWRLGADGVVRTFAGTGTAGTSTTSLAAVQTPLNTPLAVAPAADGSVYISDYLNNRVLKIGTDGRSANFVGVGQRASTGDNGPATAAAVNQPSGLALDGAGNLYIAELNGHRVRRVSTSGVITTYAGTGVAGYRGDGGFAVSAQVSSPSGLLVNAAGELVIADRDNGRLRLVLNGAPSVRIPTTPISVTPTAGSFTQRGTISLASPIPGLAFDASVRYTSTATGWLTVAPARGTLPAVLSYETNMAGLAAGDYAAQIVITVASATPRETTIPITLRVPAPPAQTFLLSGNARLTMSAVSGQTAQQAVPITNPGARPLVVRGAATRGDFLSVTPGELTIAPGQTGTFTLVATTGILRPGTYSGAAAFTSGTGSATVGIAFNVSGNSRRLTLSQTGLSFTAVSGGAAPPEQVVYIAGSDRLSIVTRTVSGAPWLSASLDGNRVSVRVDAQGLAVGDHYGRLEVFGGLQAGTGGPLSQAATVLLQVLPPGSDPGPEVSPSALLYTAMVGGEVAGQEVELVLPTNRRGTFSATGATFEGQPWLQFAPAGGSVSGGEPARVTVQPDLTGLSAGVYRGSVTLTLDDGQTRTVSILAVIGSSATAASKDGERAASSCSNTGLFPQVLAPAANFRVTIGEPVRLAARVVDGCGNLHQPESGGNAAVAVTGFGTQVVNLTHIGSGVWEGTATPNSLQATATLTFLGLFSRGTFLQAGAEKVNGAVVTAQRPFVFADSLTDAASFQFGVPVAPGTLVSLFGQNLSAANALPNALPLPATLGDVEVRLNDQPIPLLFAGPGQVNAQIPYSLLGDGEYQLEVRRGTSLTTPQPLVIAQARPGVFTVDQSGQGQGHIYRALSDGSQRLADAAGAAAAGDVLVIYCNGLGRTNPAVTAGAAAPFSPLAVTANPVSVNIGGREATILFAGLAPGFTGLYQINAQVPAGITPGGAVPVVLTVAGQASVAVTMGIQ